MDPNQIPDTPEACGGLEEGLGAGAELGQGAVPQRTPPKSDAPISHPSVPDLGDLQRAVAEGDLSLGSLLSGTTEAGRGANGGDQVSPS